jgi:hypothetical protein
MVGDSASRNCFCREDKELRTLANELFWVSNMIRLGLIPPAYADCQQGIHSGDSGNPRALTRSPWAFSLAAPDLKVSDTLPPPAVGRPAVDPIGTTRHHRSTTPRRPIGNGIVTSYRVTFSRYGSAHL